MKLRPLLIFYILAIYVFASFIWWSFLLLNKNEVAFREKVSHEKLLFNQKNNAAENPETYLQTQDYLELKQRYDRQKWMIFGEGAVFLLLLTLGSMKLGQTLKKEMQIARQQNNFLLSVTHELKSPLASMKLSLQTLLIRLNLEEKYRRLLKNSVEDVDRLNDLVENLLFAARMEGGEFSLQLELQNISALTEEITRKIRSQQKEALTLISKIENEIFIQTDRAAYTSVVVNLIENAIKYSPAGSQVEVALYRENDVVALEVKDQGSGIPENERSNIFKKFYRIGNEETRHTKGTGLGLFIVKKIIDMHAGRILIEENHPQGTIFKIFFPAEE